MNEEGDTANAKLKAKACWKRGSGVLASGVISGVLQL